MEYSSSQKRSEYRPPAKQNLTPREKAHALVLHVSTPKPWPNAIAPSKLDLWLPQHHDAFVSIVPGNWPRNKINPHWTFAVKVRSDRGLSPDSRRAIAGPAQRDAIETLFAWLMLRLNLHENEAWAKMKSITFNELVELCPNPKGSRRPLRRRSKAMLLAS